MKSRASIKLKPMLAEELAFVCSRKQADPTELIGIALSGGGVRSATLSLGFLERLSHHGVLEHSDYLSSVSGGGYANGYLLSAAHAYGVTDHEKLFGKAATTELRAAGKYLASGRGAESVFRGVRLIAALLSTTLLNLIWVSSFLVAASVLVEEVLRAIVVPCSGAPYRHA